MAKNSTIVRIIRWVSQITSRFAPVIAEKMLERLFLTPMRSKTPSRELDWVADAERSSLPYDEDRRMPILSWGQGPIVLLVHGWAGRGSQLGMHIKPLVARGYRVVTFDAPGHGGADGRESSLLDLAYAIQRVAAHVGPLEAIVAHSLGTAATTIALSQGLDARRLVYVSPPENPGQYLYQAAHFLGFDKEIAKRTQMRIEGRFGFQFQHATGSYLAKDIDIPLMVIHDREDREVSFEEGQRLVSVWQNASLLSTTGLGHNRILRDPSVSEAIVRYITMHTANPHVANAIASHNIPGTI